MTDHFTDTLLGHITVRTNVRARRIIMRAQADGVVVTVPPYTSRQTVTDTLERFHQRLRQQQLAMREKEQSNGSHASSIGPDFAIRTELFCLTLEEGERERFYLRAEPGRTVIVYPPDTEFQESERQQWLHRVVERALRQQAQWLLPERLRALSVLHGLPFKECKVSVSKGRWGSCSTKGSINLSCYLLMLPSHLREYVMLHELCHTREMNHGPRFWALLDSLTGGIAKALRNELKNYNTTF